MIRGHEPMNRVFEVAVRRAHELRAQASDAFWSEAAEVARERTRAAARWTASLARHARRRGRVTEG